MTILESSFKGERNCVHWTEDYGVSFAKIGLDSLMLIMQLQDIFSIEILDTEFIKIHTVNDLIAQVQTKI